MNRKSPAASLLRGHLLQFDRRPPPGYAPAAGARLLAVFVVLEFILGPRAHLLSWLGLPPVSPWLRITFLFSASLLAAKIWAGVRFRDLGLQPVRAWFATESLYFAQVVVVANIAFAWIYSPYLAILPGRSSLWSATASLFTLQFLWGCYQEVNYRGILQTELTRRFGSAAGPLLANLAFTFGPLHFYHWAGRGSAADAILVFGATFAIGLFFAVVFHRTRNLWIVAVFHGLGNAYVNGAPQIGELPG